MNSDIFSEDAFAAESVFIPEVVGEETFNGNRSLVEEIRPLPRFQVAERKIGRKKGYSRILTSSLEKCKAMDKAGRRCKIDDKNEEEAPPSPISIVHSEAAMEESTSRPTASEVTAGKWFLVTVRGIRRNSNFRYVARANTGVDGGEIIMQGYGIVVSMQQRPCLR